MATGDDLSRVNYEQYPRVSQPNSQAMATSTGVVNMAFGDISWAPTPSLSMSSHVAPAEMPLSPANVDHQSTPFFPDYSSSAVVVKLDVLSNSRLGSGSKASSRVPVATITSRTNSAEGRKSSPRRAAWWKSREGSTASVLSWNCCSTKAMCLRTWTLWSS